MFGTADFCFCDCALYDLYDIQNDEYNNMSVVEPAGLFCKLSDCASVHRTLFLPITAKTCQNIEL